MSIRYIVAGSVLADDVSVQIKGPINALTTAADGTFETMECEVLDPGGTLAFKQLSTFVVEETDDTLDPRSFMGMVFNVKVDRGPYLTGAGRRWTFTVQDVNYLLALRRWIGSTANRLEETGTTRLNALLSSVCLNGLVADLGCVMANAWTYPAADYRGKLATEVLADIVGAASAGRWTFFAYWDPVALAVGLFYGEANNVVLRPSTLKVSNVPGDADGTTVFDLAPGPELEGTGDEIYDGVYSVGQGNTSIYRQRAATFAEFGIHRDGIYESARNNNPTSIALHAERFLDTHNGQIDTVTCTVRLPSAKVNHITAGMSLPARFQHLPGWGASYVDARVTKRSFPMAVERSKKVYDVALTLTNRGWLTPGGGGNPGDFPHPPSQPGTLVQQKGAANIVTLDTVPADGDLLMMWVTMRTFATYPTVPSGWTQVGPDIENNTGPYHSARLMTRIASGETGTYANAAGTVVHVSEWSGVTLGAQVFLNDQALGTAVGAGGAITPAAANAIVVGNGLYGGFNPSGGVTPATGITELFEQDNPGGLSPTNWVGMKIVPSPVSTTIAATMANNEVWAGITYELLPVAGANPPSPGQDVPWTVVTMTPSGGVSVGTTPFPYAALSLKVKVDGVLISPASYVETDPATGDFALTWLLDSSEVVQVSFQGI